AETVSRTGSELVPEESLLEQGAIIPEGDGFKSVETGELLTMDNWPRQKTKARQIPKYPRGRFVLRIGDTIINSDPDDQVWKFRRWPFAFGCNQILPHTSEGLNATEMAKGLQDRVNLAERHTMNHVATHSDPVTYVEKDVLLGKQKPVNRAGAWRLLAKDGLNKIRREPGVPITAGLLSVIQSWKADLRDQTGVQEVALGRGAGGDETATEVLALQTNTKLRGGMSNVLLDDALITHFENLAELGQRMYTVDQVIRVVGDQDSESVYRIQSGDLSARFDITLDVGTSLPFDQDKTRQEAMDLFTAIQNGGGGLAGLEMLLDAYEREDKDEILKKVAAWQMIEAALAEQQAAEEGAEQPTGDDNGQV
ncbi:MAG TPA: hypothetical protein VM243_17990, partial [Phycisphaerae bacterium]|nr:hypothetical protein [Phycisphaerae bacterium]